MDNEIKEWLKTVQRAITPSRRTSYKNRGSSVIVYNDDGSIRELNISSSLVSRFYLRGNPRDYCALKNYVTIITKQFKIQPSISMLNGLYGESLLLGETADGTVITDLPRNKKTGAKLKAQLMIEKQVNNWNIMKEFHGIIVNSKDAIVDGVHVKKNIQYRQKIQWTIGVPEEITVWVYATADLITPLHINDINYDVACGDIKFTADLTSNYGEYGWGSESLKHKDHYQLVLYNRVFDMPVFYIVFDWSEHTRHEIIPVNVNPNHPDENMAREARWRIKEMEETTRKCIEDIISYEKNGWTISPSNNECRTCPNIYCKHYGKTVEI